MNPSASDNFNGPDTQTHHRVYASHMHCINAARSTGQLIGYFDQQEKLPQGVLIRCACDPYHVIFVIWLCVFTAHPYPLALGQKFFRITC
jgi:hypothetical protein